MNLIQRTIDFLVVFLDPLGEEKGEFVPIGTIFVVLGEFQTHNLGLDGTNRTKFSKMSMPILTNAGIRYVLITCFNERPAFQKSLMSSFSNFDE